MAQTTLQTHQAGRDAASTDVGELMNQVADRIQQALADGFFPDGLTVNLQRAFSAALSVGQELAPRLPASLVDVGMLDLSPPASSET